MNKQNYRKIRLKIKLGFLAMTFVSFLFSFFPIKYASAFLLAFYNINVDLPIRGQENSTAFMIFVISISVLIFLTSALVVASVVCRWNGWTRQQSIDYLVRYENLPSHWIKR
jgi:hypothetical protein